MQLTYEQKGQVLARVEHFVNLANEIYNTDLSMPCVRFDKRGRVGATACYGRPELNFNVGLMIDNWDEYMNQVVPHEVAHLVKDHVYGTESKGRLHSPHGLYWKQIMRSFGCEPDRCHSMDTSKVAQHKTKHVYKCSCCNTEVVVGPKIHKKISGGYSGYGHRGCRGSRLIFSHTAGKVSRQEAKKTNPAPEQKKAALAPKPKQRKQRSEPKAGTIAARALEIYRKFAGEDRKTVIGEIALTLNVSDKRAAQIYQGAKRNAQEFGV